MTEAFGIDLGTTNSCVALKIGSRIEVLENPQCKKVTPSVVYFGSTGKDVGEEAQSRRQNHPRNTVFHIKRFMGRSANDPEIAKGFPYPFEVLASNRGEANIRVSPHDEQGVGETRTYCPEQISALILRYMMVIAQKKIGAEVKDAVITVPATFNDAQRQATKDAGKLAGLNVLRIINEPTAAALAYGIGMASENARVVLVYDLGGGTFDVSIVRCQRFKSDVLSTSGRSALGGENFDRLIYQYATAKFMGQGVNIAANDFVLVRSCEEAKITLSESTQATITYFKNGDRYACEITREVFENLCMNLFEETIRCVDEAITLSGIDKDDIDDIVLVGGSSSIPKLRQMLRNSFGNKELKFYIPPAHAVAMGAAILADSLSANPELSQNAPYGSVKIMDALPFSLGTNVTYGRFSVILRKNAKYPVSNTEGYENTKANLTEMEFKIFEGDQALYKENKQIGACRISVPPRKIGENNIEVTFSVDADGILSVHLRDADTAVEASTKVQTSRFTEEELLEMVRDLRLEEEQERTQRAKYQARTAFGLRISDNDAALIRSCKEAIITLTDSDEAAIPYFSNGNRYEWKITRQIFEDLCSYLVEHMITCVQETISESGYDEDDIDDIVLAGGSSRIPMIRQKLRHLFGNRELRFHIPCDHAVAKGAAILADLHSSNLESVKGKLAKVLPFSLGIDCKGAFDPILKRNSIYPITRTVLCIITANNCSEVVLKILEGNNALSEDNKYLGDCRIAIPKGKLGKHLIEITFSVDAHGILSVRLKDEDTALESSTRVQTVDNI